MDFVILNTDKALDASTGKLCLDFRLLTGEGVLVRDVTDFKYKEDDRDISKYESEAKLYPLFEPYAYTLLLLDVSGGIVDSGNLENLKDVVLEFIESDAANNADWQKSQTAVYAFDGSRDMRLIAPFTNSLTLLNAAVSGLDNTCMQDCSSNLHGAIMESLLDLEGKAGKETYGARLVIISDFGHNAGVDASTVDASTADGTDYPSWETVTARIKASHHAIYAVGIGPELDQDIMRAVGRDGVIEIGASSRNRAATFDSWHRGNQRYRVCYCSPARVGKHSFTIEAKKDGYSASYSHAFDANANFVHCEIP
ncbi:MAG: VWA domain-containing protein [Anaerolineae bacterium]|nr:VWA domain-containing protein [Anaerolineae bacterium]